MYVVEHRNSLLFMQTLLLGCEKVCETFGSCCHPDPYENFIPSYLEGRPS